MPNRTKQFRVLIVRLGAMGDILHSLPAVTALRQRYPDWYMGWAVEPQWTGLLAAPDSDVRGISQPLVDRLHVVPAKRWAREPFARRTWSAIRELRRELQDAHYDACLDLQGAVRSAMIGRLAGTGRIIGEDKPREAAARWLFHDRVPTEGVHVIEQAVEVTSRLAGVPLPVVPPALPVDPETEQAADAFRRPFVLLNPGAGWGAKRWPIERYAVVAHALHAAGYGIVVNLGPGEKFLGKELRAAAGDFVQLTEPSLTELIALTRRCSLLIAGDTGPLHLASALGRPVVGIFGPTDPARNGPFGGRFHVLRHPESRRDHTRRAEPESGLLTITPEAVLEAALDLLDARNKENL
ncbi:glycosyltransferase family 9 protein [Silvibacterium dinghuense]|nr:glycosyltransferase family 9 protein [Silvibacterium dinghuense]GGG96142.1 lipopolysaccharide heptosyltransferase I [Silvibacterium dinghuense]